VPRQSEDSNMFPIFGDHGVGASNNSTVVRGSPAVKYEILELTQGFEAI
jgi:hypothetical protein